MVDTAQDGTGLPRALVLGTEHPRSAAVIRSLAAAGVAVDVGDHCDPPTALWRGSNGIRNRHLLREDEEAVFADLLRIGENAGEGGGGLLIPTNDHYLMIASRHHETLSRHFTVTVPPWLVLVPLMDKVTAKQLAERSGIEVPAQFQPQTPEELDAVLASLDFENQAYVLKIRLWDSGPADFKTLRRVAKAGEDAASMRARCEEIRAENGEYPLIEEVVPGGADRCIGVSMVVDRNHEPVVAYGVRRLKLQLYATGKFKHPYELGANAYCESAVDPEAVELATRFVKEAKYTGAITVELKRDSRNDRIKFIKADCRVVRATRLSQALGLDVPTALYDVFTGRNAARTYPTSHKDGVKWLWLEAYAYSLWKNRREIAFGRELWNLAKRIPSVGAWAYFDWRDPMPAVILALTARRRLKLLENPGERKAAQTGKLERAVSG